MQSLLRWLTVLGVIGVVTAGIVVLALGLFQGPTTSTTPPPAVALKAQAQAPAAPVQPAQVAHAAERGADVQTPVQPAAAALPRVSLYRNLVTIPDCHFNIYLKQEVPSQRPGQLLYVATEPKPGDVFPDDQAVNVTETYAYIEVGPNDKLPPGTEKVEVTIGSGDHPQTRICRRLLDTDKPASADLTSKVFIATRDRKLKLLKEGDMVNDGDLLALVDPAIAVDDYVSKATKVEAAKADQKASKKTCDEAEQRYLTMQRLYNGSTSRTVSLEDLRGAKLTWDRYFFEEISKGQAIKQAEAELNAALTVLKLHEIRAKRAGVVKAVNKQRGEAVKGFEQGGDQIVLINHIDRLRIEGLVDVQYIGRLKEGSQVVVEPSQPQSPLCVLTGHLQPIKSVAVSKNFRIVSASEDSTHVWDRRDRTNWDDVQVPTPSSTLAVACSPKEAEQNLLATGGADGITRLWNLAEKEKEPALVAELKDDSRRGPVHAVAFSPDGRWVATGDDKAVCLWGVDGQRLQEPFTEGHIAGITSVKFLSPKQLVSAGRDNRLVLWTLGDDGRPAGSPKVMHGRGGKVSDLGVNPKTREVIFDQGSELRLLSMPGGHIEGALENAGGTLDFTNMAQFSPDGLLVLTNAASDNRVQLWRLPTRERRGYELRQLIWAPAPVTCGAFAPAAASDAQNAFIVTGTEDKAVVVWEMPSQEEATQELVATVTYVERALDTASRQIRIWAEIDNKARRLIPGNTATLVEYPTRK
jgi:WD40 repeat protein